MYRRTVLKQTKVGQYLTELYIEEYKQDKPICVVEAFHAYVEKTKMLSGNYSRCLLDYKNHIHQLQRVL